MDRASPVPRFGTTESDRHESRETDRSVGGVLADICRFVLWPENTAPCLASAADCSVRQAERFLGGHCEWSGDAQAAVFQEILKRRGVRHLRVKAK